MLQPRTIEELAACVATAKEPFELLGAGTKRRLGRPVVATPLSLASFNRVIAYEPEELILEAGAGITLSEIDKLLQQRQQMLAFEPPDFSKLLGSKHAGTLGGTLACNLSGPRRISAGAARDHVLGIRGVNGSGEIFKSGARVVKNVTGYDVPRLMAGSYGTLAALTAIIFKVLPKPETELTLQSVAQDAGAALTLMTMAMQSSCEVSGAAFVPGTGVFLRLEGIPLSIAYRAGKLRALLALPCEHLDAAASRQVWASIRDAAALKAPLTDTIWRISLAPQEAPRVVDELQRHFSFRYILDWAGGLLWLTHATGENHASLIRQSASPGAATLFRADEEARQTMAVFPPLPSAHAALSLRLKQSFDPKGLFNPGRMVQGA